MSDIFLMLISDNEINKLYGMMQIGNEESSYRFKIILFKNKEYTVPEIRMAVNHHYVDIRKWIHRFNEHGVKNIQVQVNQGDDRD